MGMKDIQLFNILS